MWEYRPMMNYPLIMECVGFISLQQNMFNLGIRISLEAYDFLWATDTVIPTPRRRSNALLKCATILYINWLLMIMTRRWSKRVQVRKRISLQVKQLCGAQNTGFPHTLKPGPPWSGERTPDIILWTKNAVLSVAVDHATETLTAKSNEGLFNLNWANGLYKRSVRYCYFFR